MGNKLATRNTRPKKRKAVKNGGVFHSGDELEFKFIINEVLMNNSRCEEGSIISKKFSVFESLLKSNRVEQMDLLDAYYVELNNLTFNYAKTLNPNMFILKILRATCFSREQETECVRMYIQLKSQNKKMCVDINDLFISSLEAVSARTCKEILNYLKLNLKTEKYEDEMNRLFSKTFSSNSYDLMYPGIETPTLPSTSSAAGGNYVTVLDAFIWKYSKQLSVYLHKNEFIVANELYIYLKEMIVFIHDLILAGCKMNNYVYDQYSINKYYNILFLMYYNVRDLDLFANRERFNIDVCLNACLKQILTSYKLSTMSDNVKTEFYYKLKKCTFQRWSGENKLLMKDLIESQSNKQKYKPLALSDFCRIAIRNSVGNANVNKLILPRRIHEYLCFKDDIIEDIDLYFQIVY